MRWGVPGFLAEELIGVGASGEVWRGRDRGTGEAVALKRLRVGGDASDRAAIEREAAVLAGFRHPHVLGFRTAVPTEDGLVLVLDLAAGGSLARLLTAVGQLTAGQLVTAISPVAGALAAAHGRGLVHGDVSPGNILLTRDGRPLLADLGTARLLGEPPGAARGTAGYLDPRLEAGAPADPAGDVFALGAVAAHALTGAPLPDAGQQRALITGVAGAGAGPAVLDAVASALDPDPVNRPAAAEFAAALRGAAVAAPLPLRAVPAGTHDEVHTHAAHPSHPLPPPPSAPGAGRHRPLLRKRRALPVRTVVVAGLLLAFAVAGGLAWGARTHPEQAAAIGSPRRALASPTAAPDPTWRQVLSSLDARRAAAFASADPALLEQVYAAGSPALATDGASIRRLRAGHAIARGVHHDLVRVSELITPPATGERAALRVVDRLPAYQIVDQHGQVLATEPARGERTMRVELVRTDQGWRIADLAAD